MIHRIIIYNRSARKLDASCLFLTKFIFVLGAIFALPNPRQHTYNILKDTREMTQSLIAYGDLVQRYRELAEVVIIEHALRVGRSLKRERLRHFDVEGTGLDQAVNLLERRILILPVIRR